MVGTCQFFTDHVYWEAQKDSDLTKPQKYIHVSKGYSKIETYNCFRFTLTS